MRAIAGRSLAKVVSMLDRIRSLAHFIAVKKNTDRKFVLMLGAGASLSSGVKTTATIVQELVQTYGTGPAPGALEDRFDDLWRQAAPDDRRLMLKSYLDQTPSRGYQRLADLIQLGYFDIVLTFNFDRLVERALDDAGFRDYHLIIRGETAADALGRLVHSTEPRVKILKLHGSLHSADYFLFSKEEMLNYPPDLRTIIADVTGRDIIICGYAFNDLCVIKAFNDSRDSGAIYYVNPSGAGENIKGYLSLRRSQERVISGDLGRFDDFFDALHQELTRPVAPVTAKQRHNLFKFLDHYQEEHKSWFLGRRKQTRELAKRIDATASTPLFFIGQSKVGKTSFIRAGLIPYLAPRYDCIYVRCQRDLESQLRTVLAVRYGEELARMGWDDVFARLKALSSKRVILFLDQFERLARACDESRDNRRAILDFVNRLLTGAAGTLTVVCVAVDEKAFWKLLSGVTVPERDPLEIEPLSPVRVASILRHSARKGGIQLAPTVIEQLCRDYRQTLEHPSDKHHFTLTHVQTICYYLVKGQVPNWEGYDRLPNQGLIAALDSVKGESSLIDLLDDLPSDERRLIRSFLKVICDPTSNTRRVVEFIRDHFPDIKEDRFPEPLA